MSSGYGSERRSGRVVNSLCLIALLGGVALVAACAPTSAPQGAPTANLVSPPVGSKWIVTQRDSGSFGSSSQQITTTRLADQVWEGKKVRAYSDGTTTRFVDIDAGRTVAVVKDGTPVESFEPGVGWRWPLWVGNSWLETFRYTDHVRGRTFNNVQSWYKVGAYEDVTVPAGTFKTFRVEIDADGGAFVGSYWWTPDRGLVVKSKVGRSSRHYLGIGTREGELISYHPK